MEEFNGGVKNGRFDEYDGLAVDTGIKDSTFKRFKRKNVMASRWISDLVQNGYRYSNKRGRKRGTALLEEGLFMSDEMPDIGVLSIAPALSALLSEIKLLKDTQSVEEDRKNGEKDAQSFEEVLTADNSKILKVVANSVCKLLSECYPDGVHGNYKDVLLSSMPFYDDSSADENLGWDKGGYLDTASWVFLVADLVEAFLKRLERELPDVYKKFKWEVRYTKIGENDATQIVTEALTAEEVKSAVREIYLSCIKVTCDCIIKRDGKVLGWSFRKMEEGAEPSLYFSYVASTVYLGLFKRFNSSDETISELRKFEERLLKNADTRKFRFYEGIADPASREKTYAWLERNGFEDFASYLKKYSNDNSKYEELDLLYNVINNGQPLTDKINERDKYGAFTLLKNSSVELAKTLWEEGFGTYKNKIPFQVNMAKGPCFEDGSLVDMDIVRKSGHSNAFFNNLFVIGIILNSAYDAELAKENSDKYDKMLNTFQLSIQNTQRCYNEIESSGLLYKIDSYILDFSDKVDERNTELAKQLRRVNMAVVPLMPLMLKNNNLMSEYLVRYPQKQMTESLKNIIRNKKRKNGASSWVWDKDGYNAITNYYYIDALISFYTYYENYEEPYVESEEDKNIREQKKINETKAEYEIKLLNKETQLRAEISKKDEYISEVRELGKGLAKLVVNGLIDLVDEQITYDNLVGALSEDETFNKDTVIKELNSKDKADDSVKLSKLVRLTEKLQLLSLLTMSNDERLKPLFTKGDSNVWDEPYTIVKNVLGNDGATPKFMFNMIASLAGLLVANNNKSDGGNDNHD
ncbi:MAG: hypothetical protein K2L42_00370 [Clostridia bacterium]|nr:hypothetical protein [Clostridia bacterium]